MRRAFWIAAALAVAACSAPSSPLPGVSLPTLGGASAGSLAECAADKCLRVYLTPWCPHCRDAAPYVVKLRDMLARKGIPTAVIVGQDQPDTLTTYARFFGPDTVLDRDQAVRVNGVPHFWVIDRRGRLVKDIAGFPAYFNGTVEQLAEHFGLP